MATFRIPLTLNVFGYYSLRPFDTERPDSTDRYYSRSNVRLCEDELRAYFKLPPFCEEITLVLTDRRNDSYYKVTPVYETFMRRATLKQNTVLLDQRPVNDYYYGRYVPDTRLVFHVWTALRRLTGGKLGHRRPLYVGVEY